MKEMKELLRCNNICPRKKSRLVFYRNYVIYVSESGLEIKKAIDKALKEKVIKMYEDATQKKFLQNIIIE